MSFMENFQYVTLGAAVGFFVYNIVPITSYLFNLMTLSPGVGRVFSRTHPKSKQKGVFVDTNIGRVKIPFVKLPSPDTEIYFFVDEKVVEKRGLINRTVFNERYKYLQTEPLKRYDLGIITDILKPTDFKNKKRICGFISSIFEDYIYLFVVEDDIINYEKIFENFDDALLDLDRTSSDELENVKEEEEKEEEENDMEIIKNKED